MFFNQTVGADGSFVKVTSKDASEMAIKTLAWVKKLRDDREARAIEIERQKINDGFWHKLFRLKEATVEDAKESLAYDHWNFDYHFTNQIAFKNEEAANRILNACKHASEIFISTEDLQKIS
jgi:hypothetical protein